MKKAAKFDKMIYGVILGLVVPVITFIITWKFAYDGTLSEYYSKFSQIHKLSSLISLSAIPNLLVFFLFYRIKMDRAARGVILATLVVGIIMIIIKFF